MLCVINGRRINYKHIKAWTHSIDRSNCYLKRHVVEHRA